ncbi:MAG: Bug family tripartite tricarboxylate transporter substrate binding protein [Lautropia sp.]
MRPHRHIARALTLGFAMCLGTAAFAQPKPASDGFPTKPIRFVIPYGPGNSVDVVTRMVARKLHERLGWATIVENRPGGRLTIAMQAVLDAPADGHTLLGSVSAMPVMPSAMKELQFDLLRDFEWITRTANLQLMLAAGKSVQFQDAAQMVGYARKHPDELKFAAYQPGSGTHLVGEYFADLNGIRMSHVPYKDSSFATDLAGGSIDLAIFSVTTLAPVLQSGRARGLALLGKQRSPLFPDVPTTAEQGLPAIDVDIWAGITAKAGTPRPIVDRLHKEIDAVLQLPEVKEFIVAQGGLPGGDTPAAFKAKVASEVDMWRKLIQEKKIRTE